MGVESCGSWSGASHYMFLLVCRWVRHWMTQVNWVTVEVDGLEAVQAESYIGNPTDNEADAFLLVHSPDAGDYILSFGNESYRVATSKEYIRLRRHAWTLKPIGDGQFINPMPFERLNEYRISSGGHLVKVRF